MDTWCARWPKEGTPKTGWSGVVDMLWNHRICGIFSTENLMFETLKLFFHVTSGRDIRSYMLHINASHYQVPSGSCSSCETACLSESRPTHCRVTACFWSFCRNAFIWWPLFGATAAWAEKKATESIEIIPWRPPLNFMNYHWSSTIGDGLNHWGWFEPLGIVYYCFTLFYHHFKRDFLFQFGKRSARRQCACMSNSMAKPRTASCRDLEGWLFQSGRITAVGDIF